MGHASQAVQQERFHHEPWWVKVEGLVWKGRLSVVQHTCWGSTDMLMMTQRVQLGHQGEPPWCLKSLFSAH